MIDVYSRVLAFMFRFDQKFPEDFRPTVPSDEVVRQRCRWQLEETLELLEACFEVNGFEQTWARANVRDARMLINEIINTARVDVDIVAYADANADIRYVAYGNDIAAGIDSREVDVEVCLSNDSKSPPEEPGGKVRKGPTYKAPDIEGVLRDQGWKGSKP